MKTYLNTLDFLLAWLHFRLWRATEPDHGLPRREQRVRFGRGGGGQPEGGQGGAPQDIPHKGQEDTPATGRGEARVRDPRGPARR